MNISFHYYPEIDSTNNELRRRLAPMDTAVLPDEYTVVSAGMQTMGRGRSGHSWVSKPKVSISTSIVIYPGDIGEEITKITLLAAVSVCRAVESLTGLDPRIKWVNDVLLENKKICGILTERVPENNAVIVGIGVNLRMGSYPAELKDMAVSIEEVIGKPVKLSGKRLTELIWQFFVGYYESFLETFDIHDVLEDYNSRLINTGRQVKVLDPAGEYSAVALGADESGRLIVRLQDGEIRKVDSGEVSVRGIYGYGI